MCSCVAGSGGGFSFWETYSTARQRLVLHMYDFPSALGLSKRPAAAFLLMALRAGVGWVEITDEGNHWDIKALPQSMPDDNKRLHVGFMRTPETHKVTILTRTMLHKTPHNSDTRCCSHANRSEISWVFCYAAHGRLWASVWLSLSC